MYNIESPLQIQNSQNFWLCSGWFYCEEVNNVWTSSGISLVGTVGRDASYQTEQNIGGGDMDTAKFST